MTPRKKITLMTIGSWAGSVVAVAAVVSLGWTAATNQIAEYIDSRIDCKMQYAVELLKQITTPEQQKQAEDAVRRWETKK